MPNLQNIIFSSMSRSIKSNHYSVNPDSTQLPNYVNTSKFGTLVNHQTWMKSQKQQIVPNENSYLINHKN